MPEFNIEDKFVKFVKLFVKLWRRDSHTLAAVQTRITCLKDASVDIIRQSYNWVQGGREFKAQTITGERPNTSTFRQAFGFKIRIESSPDG